MDGLVIIIAVLIAVGVAARMIMSRSPLKQKEPQTTETPGRRTPPDDWPRDGGNNPSGP
jgi:hypothetical protein